VPEPGVRGRSTAPPPTGVDAFAEFDPVLRGAMAVGIAFVN
jgi:hypothetical protein